MPITGTTEVVAMLKKLRPDITISLGVASVVPKLGTSPATLVAAADRALYQAKRSGRNCVELAAP